MVGHRLDQDVVDGMDIGSGRRSKVLEGTFDSDVVAGKDVVNWKGWKGTDVVDGRGLDPDDDRKDWKWVGSRRC